MSSTYFPARQVNWMEHVRILPSDPRAVGSMMDDNGDNNDINNGDDDDNNKH